MGNMNQSTTRRLTENDLEPWAKRNLEKAYETRERPRCSREDFADGFIAGLVSIRARTEFKPGTLE
jgi:hypothetical protein